MNVYVMLLAAAILFSLGAFASWLAGYNKGAKDTDRAWSEWNDDDPHL